MAHTWNFKDPDEEYEYTHDWANRLLVDGADVGDSILGPDHADPDKRPTLVVTEGDVELTEIVQIPGTAELQYWLRAGTTETRFTGTVWTVQGRKFQESFKLKVKER
jgi:hypothetical protein